MRLSTKQKVPKIVLEEKQLRPKLSTVWYIAKTMSITLVFTMFVAAVFHLSLIFLFAIIRKNISLINPLDFLGIGIVYPNLKNSDLALLIGWLMLVLLFWLVYTALNKLEFINELAVELFNKLYIRAKNLTKH